ncbi:MAG: lipoprotein [Gammaproteobacteria bacterium]|nr:lipoprotein [Gammaproteobacteria bacterium]
MRTVCIMLLLLVGLQGCGRKGPLYMPPAQSQFSAVSHQSQSAELQYE